MPEIAELEGVEQHTFQELLEGRQDEFPLLARATRYRMRAYRTRIAWPVGNAAWINNTQIVRTAVVADAETEEDALTRHLRQIEKVLRSGKHTKLADGRTSGCAGVYQYLLREPNERDVINLLALQEPMLLRHPSGTEWLSEFSLEVIPRG